MNVLEAIRTRRSVRKDADKPVPAETLKEIAEAGTWAASGFHVDRPPGIPKKHPWPVPHPAEQN
ncbi:MAG: nitroreductase family protein [Solobacterium sp.]|nr:nitroreductase family protein [Solobacterium sp.]